MAEVTIPRLDIQAKVEDVNGAVEAAVRRLGYDAPTTEQKDAVTAFVKGKDVFVSLPTGSGKSLCYACLPWVFDALRSGGQISESQTPSIVVVVSPLISLMKDQVSFFNSRGLSCEFVGIEQTDANAAARVTNGESQLVYLSPESMLTIFHWRQMLQSAVYQDNLMGVIIDEAHCVEKWGHDFRQEYANIAEVRSIIPQHTNIMALTATASIHTRENITVNLNMKDNCFVVCQLPNRVNICYQVYEKPSDPVVAFLPFLNDLIQQKAKACRCVVFCPTYSACDEVYSLVASHLLQHNAMYDPPNAERTVQNRLCEMYTACTSTLIKDKILESFTNPDGKIRFLVATVAFGMGVNAPNIHNSIHWGCSDSIDAYMQESGRCGRDRKQSFAILYYSKKQLLRKKMDGSHVISEDMRIYCVNESVCRRKLLMSAFEESPCFDQPKPTHFCCDVCACTCLCSECGQPKPAPPTETEAKKLDYLHHVLTGAQQQAVIDKVTQYRDSLCEDTPLMFGKEIVTCLPNSLIKKIGKQAATIGSVSHLFQLGVVSVGVAEDIISIIQDIKCTEL